MRISPYPLKFEQEVELVRRICRCFRFTSQRVVVAEPLQCCMQAYLRYGRYVDSHPLPAASCVALPLLWELGEEGCLAEGTRLWALLHEGSRLGWVAERLVKRTRHDGDCLPVWQLPKLVLAQASMCIVIFQLFRSAGMPRSAAKGVQGAICKGASQRNRWVIRKGVGYMHVHCTLPSLTASWNGDLSLLGSASPTFITGGQM